MLPSKFSALLQSLSLSRGHFKPTPYYLNHQIELQSTPHGQQSTQPVSNHYAAQQVYTPRSRISSRNDQHYFEAQADPDPCYVEPYNVPAPPESPFDPYDPAKATIYRFRQQQSVNLGSWFVHESWMTPSLFKCASGPQVAEIDIAYGWGSQEAARSLLERHWDTFITQADFDYLARIGINTVRLPIGYWSLGPGFLSGTPFEPVAAVYRNSWSRVLRSISMASSAGIGVLVDLHGAVGSQNGQPHSGVSDGATNLFTSPDNVAKTLEVLKFLMQQLCYVTNIVGIQILNEPQYVPQLEDFYSTAIEIMRQVNPSASSFPLYMHNGFDLDRFTQYTSARADFVVQDHHSYFVFTPWDASKPANQHTIDVDSGISDGLARASEPQHRNLVVDEWSCALTPESLAGEADPVIARRDFCTGQMEVYTNQTAGWSFWSYLKEGCEDDPGWCFKSAVGNSLPSSFFSYAKVDMSNSGLLRSIADAVEGMSPPSLSSITQQWQLNTFDSSIGLPGSFTEVHTRRILEGRNGLQGAAADIKGYSDGFLTAKIFAMYQMSKLGFTGQYIANSLHALGSLIQPGSEGIYQESFMKGLRDGEKLVGTVGV